jgi:hypothetical protein
LTLSSNPLSEKNKNKNCLAIVTFCPKWERILLYVKPGGLAKTRRWKSLMVLGYYSITSEESTSYYFISCYSDLTWKN